MASRLVFERASLLRGVGSGSRSQQRKVWRLWFLLQAFGIKSGMAWHGKALRGLVFCFAHNHRKIFFCPTTMMLEMKSLSL